MREIDLQSLRQRLIRLDLAPEEIHVSNVGVESDLTITFSIAWQGSFQNLAEPPRLCDAAWVFLKYRTSSSAPWLPVELSTDASDHRAETEDCRIVPAEDGSGVFVRNGSSGPYFGPVAWQVRLHPTNLQQRNGLQLRIAALRMVRVAAGSFWLGDPQDSCTGSFSDACREEDYAYRVDSEDEMQVGECGGAAKSLYYSSSGGDRLGPIPAAFPKGYQAFYLMRSQVTQFQYAQFINSLLGDQKTLRFNYGEGAYRYTIRKDRSGNRIATRPRRACNYLSWDDGLAFAAWAGLRPMTELEFEKACRGPLQTVAEPWPSSFAGEPVPQEYAWGSTDIVLAEVIVGYGSAFLISGNCNTDNATTDFYGGDGGRGPVEAGRLWLPDEPSFELAVPTDMDPHARLTMGSLLHPKSVGASRTGALGLSGNLWEFCVAAGLPSGRTFTGSHGTGELTASGEAPSSLGWPRDGFGFRGGSWYTPASRCRVADRSYASGLGGRYTYRSLDGGFRCVRTAPAGDLE